MKVITKKYYICEVCGKKSQDEEKIKACVHQFVGEECKIEQMFENGKTYPNEIRITFEDGAKGAYCRVFLEQAPVQDGEEIR